jgi:rubrerythrin
VEEPVIRELLKRKIVVIAVGGGGIPVVKKKGGLLQGCAAVIDKDAASALLAAHLEADLLVISTGVDKVAINFGKPDQRNLDRITAAEARRYMKQGHFAAGSMKPKIEAALNFLQHGGAARHHHPAPLCWRKRWRGKTARTSLDEASITQRALRTPREDTMHVSGYRCLACGTTQPASFTGFTCPACGQNLELVYDYAAAARAPWLDRRDIFRYARCFRCVRWT